MFSVAGEVMDSVADPTFCRTHMMLAQCHTSCSRGCVGRSPPLAVPSPSLPISPSLFSGDVCLGIFVSLGVTFGINMWIDWVSDFRMFCTKMNCVCMQSAQPEPKPAGLIASLPKMVQPPMVWLKW